MLRPQVVIFDIGTVRTGWNPGRFNDAQIGAAARRRLAAETGLIAMNREVDAGRQDFAPTDFGVCGLSFAGTQHEARDEFDRAPFSGNVGGIKPDPRLRQGVEADRRPGPARHFFSDGKPGNVATAAPPGWQVHLLRTARDLADQLDAAKVFTGEEAVA